MNNVEHAFWMNLGWYAKLSDRFTRSQSEYIQKGLERNAWLEGFDAAVQSPALNPEAVLQLIEAAEKVLKALTMGIDEPEVDKAYDELKVALAAMKN